MRLKNQDNRELPTRNEPTLIMVIRGGYILSKDPLNRKPITIKYLGNLAIKLIINCSILSFILLFLYSILMFEPDSAGRLGRDGKVSRHFFQSQVLFYKENGKLAENQEQLSLDKQFLNSSDRALIKNINSNLSVIMSLVANSSDGKWHIGTIAVEKNPSRDRPELRIFYCRFINKGIVQIPDDVQLKQLSENGRCPMGTQKIDSKFGNGF
jgi:hypothetical protein